VKKAIAIFFLVVYGFTSIGATLHDHYCMDEYVGTTMWKVENAKCGKCGMKETANKKGCCKDEQKEFKIKTDHQKANVAEYVKVLFTPVLLSEYLDYKIAIPTIIKLCYSNYHPPPDIGIQNLQVLYCTYLI
jgi:hypothetical protein